jgi:hypothetical protein
MTGRAILQEEIFFLQGEFRPAEGEDHHRRYLNLFPFCSNKDCGQIIRTREKIFQHL